MGICVRKARDVQLLFCVLAPPQRSYKVQTWVEHLAEGLAWQATSPNRPCRPNTSYLVRPKQGYFASREILKQGNFAAKFAPKATSCRQRFRPWNSTHRCLMSSAGVLWSLMTFETRQTGGQLAGPLRSL